MTTFWFAIRFGSAAVAPLLAFGSVLATIDKNWLLAAVINWIVIVLLGLAFIAHLTFRELEEQR